MGRIAKPWWREDRKAYFATVHGKQRKLGTNLRAAQSQLKKILAEPEVPVNSNSVGAVFDSFLDWTLENRSAKTYRGYKDYCQSFHDKYPNLMMRDLSSSHVTAWLSSKKSWNSTTKRGAVTCLMRAFNWAMKNDGLASNPIKGMEKPEYQTRTSTLTLKEFKAILRLYRDRNFRWLLIFCWDCGCRPQEVKALEKRHIDLAGRRCILPTSEAKGKRNPRVIYLATNRACRIVQKLMKENPVGPIFLNLRGRPWTSAAVKCRFARLEKKLGKRFRMYDWRHTWITRKLIAGVDSHVLATLAGHSNPSMIHQVYSHVAQDHKFMLEQSQREV